MLAARFLTGNEGGQLSNARTEILPHQIFAAHRVVCSRAAAVPAWPTKSGLGKTIEAGMIWQALTQRGQARRTLIITPAGLTTQWQEEMQDKFGANFEIFGRDFLAVNPRIWDLKATAIASLDTLKRAEHKRILLENRKWDLIIFDEAHRLSATDYGGTGKVEKTQNYQAGRGNPRPALLRRAAPADRHAAPGRREPQPVQEPAAAAGRQHRLHRPGGSAAVRRATGAKFTDLVIRTPKKDVTDAKGASGLRRPADAPHALQDVRRRSAVLQGRRAVHPRRLPDRWSGWTTRMQKRAAGFLLTTFQKLNASSTAAIESALRSRLLQAQGGAGRPAGGRGQTSGSSPTSGSKARTQERERLRTDAEVVEDEMETLEGAARNCR